MDTANDRKHRIYIHVEHLREGCFLLRVGARGPFPKPYRFSLTVVERDGFAEPVGFDHKDFDAADFEAVIRKINRVTQKLVAYWRAMPSPRRVFQIYPGLTKGRIVMATQTDRSHLSHTHIPSPARAQKRDGSINMATLKKDGDKAFKLFASGKENMLNVERIVFADGSVLDCFHHIAAIK